MPTYVYQCENCATRFEAWQKISDEPITLCPTCSGHVRRVLFPVGLVFKGSGFYVTDHHGTAPVNGAPASESASGDASVAAASSSNADGAKSESAKSNGAKSESAKTDGATSNGAKPSGASPAAAARPPAATSTGK